MISIANRRWRVPTRRRLSELLQRSVRVARRSRVRGHVSVAFIGDGAMRRLNDRTRGVDRVTDVLSFVYRQSATDLEGEIVIAYPYARKQADRIGHGVQRELEFLFVHGMLHVLGYDHERSATEDRRMRNAQRQVLARLSTPV